MHTNVAAADGDEYGEDIGAFAPLGNISAHHKGGNEAGSGVTGGEAVVTLHVLSHGDPDLLEHTAVPGVGPGPEHRRFQPQVGQQRTDTQTKKHGRAQLAALLKGAFRGTGAPIHVNLIRVNEVKETGFKEGSVESANNFAKALEKLGVVATVRRRLGADVNAACGQLRRNNAVGKI